MQPRSIISVEKETNPSIENLHDNLLSLVDRDNRLADALFEALLSKFAILLLTKIYIVSIFKSKDMSNSLQYNNGSMQIIFYYQYQF